MGKHLVIREMSNYLVTEKHIMNPSMRQIFVEDHLPNMMSCSKCYTDGQTKLDS